MVEWPLVAWGALFPVFRWKSPNTSDIIAGEAERMKFVHVIPHADLIMNFRAVIMMPAHLQTCGNLEPAIEERPNIRQAKT